MAHENLKFCEMRVPPQKNAELSGLRLKATANGNRSEGKRRRKNSIKVNFSCKIVLTVSGSFSIHNGLGMR